MRKQLLYIFSLFIAVASSAQNTDIRWLRQININRNQKLDHVFLNLTNSATAVTYGTSGVMILTGAIGKNKQLFRNGLELLGSETLNLLLTQALKNSFKRTRPYNTYPDLDNVIEASGYSFPSGHTSIVFNNAATLSMQYPKWYIIAPSYMYASFVAYSRMHLGVHYPSDILGGIVVGTGSAFAARWIRKKIEHKKQQKVKQVALY
ncbi:MAG: phosphatase PAP2 family protein [Chitinophagaceae bacterium]|nr:phosphatase PAP2 family protein [Chitinophagaceae bacterium]